MNRDRFLAGIFTPPDVNIWEHERKTATTLAKAGFNVIFRKASNRFKEQSADCYINGELWELKAPDGKTLKSVERNLKRGRWQSSKIVFDTHRMSGVPDHAILREIRTKIQIVKRVDVVKFIDKRRNIIDITK